MVISVPAPSSTATVIASATTKMICATPVPKKRTNRSPTPTPTATPTITSATRRNRWPKLNPRAIIAATGAKNGVGWPTTYLASAHETPAASAHWAMKNARSRNRFTRRRTEARDRRAACGAMSSRSSRNWSNVSLTGSTVSIIGHRAPA